MQRCGQEDPLEQKMAVHSSTVAWKIPWTKEPSRLQSMGVEKGSDPTDQLSIASINFQSIRFSL